jgi:small nuclear ribonucleoprotein G
MDKRLFLNLQGNRKLSGVLRGFDIFLNLVLDEAQEESLEGGEKRKMGLIVSVDHANYHVFLHFRLV